MIEGQKRRPGCSPHPCRNIYSYASFFDNPEAAASLFSLTSSKCAASSFTINQCAHFAAQYFNPHHTLILPIMRGSPLSNMGSSLTFAGRVLILAFEGSNSCWQCSPSLCLKGFDFCWDCFDFVWNGLSTLKHQNDKLFHQHVREETHTG
jgi:hypothetical protein